MTTYRLADGVEPYATYHVTTAELTDAHSTMFGYCQYCPEGSDLTTGHTHELYVTRAGAASHTADELAALIHHDAAGLLDGYEYPADLPDPDGWCEDPDDSQALSDSIAEAESALSDAGLGVYWDEGYVIERVVTDDENGAPTEHHMARAQLPRVDETGR